MPCSRKCSWKIKISHLKYSCVWIFIQKKHRSQMRVYWLFVSPFAYDQNIDWFHNPPPPTVHFYISHWSAIHSSNLNSTTQCPHQSWIDEWWAKRALKLITLKWWVIPKDKMPNKTIVVLQGGQRPQNTRINSFCLQSDESLSTTDMDGDVYPVWTPSCYARY